MEMEKMVIFHRLTDENLRPATERWFRRYHVPEVLCQYPWTVRYLLYRPVPPPPGGEDFALYDYRIHENWAQDFHQRRSGRGLLPMTPGPQGSVKAEIVHIPAEPTEDFFGQELTYEGHSILRWVVAIRYPKGVDKQEGEDWFLNTHVPEVMRQPGLIRFFSHKCVEFEGDPLPISTKDSEGKGHEESRHWDRLYELWYENNEGWVESILRNPPAYTKPAWASWDRYPFLKPEEDLISTFILESPDCDFTREFRQMYY